MTIQRMDHVGVVVDDLEYVFTTLPVAMVGQGKSVEHTRAELRMAVRVVLGRR